MLSLLFILVIAVFLFGYVAVPLLWPGAADPLPDARDPITVDLEEERDALFRAIRELEHREDLPQTRRTELRARYEAKAARVLRALDEREGELEGLPTAPRPRPKGRRVPVATLSLLGSMVVSASLLGGYVLPRVGQNATVTTADARQLSAARALQTLQRNAERDPNAENLLALADGYWQAGEADAAGETYTRITQEITPVPALAYRRLGFLALQADIEAASVYLERAREADSTDLDTLFALGEIYFSSGRLADAVEVWESYLAAPGGADDPDVLGRLETARELGPLFAAVDENPNETNLLALADTFWEREERERAASLYFQVLSELNPDQPRALGRIGQLLFLSGRTDDAVGVLERARAAGDDELQTFLFLGNAYFSLGDYQRAIDAWEVYVETAGGVEAAGRVPGLIEDARARLNGETPEEGSAQTPAETPTTLVSGESVYNANCSSCHGISGGGGAGPRLAGHPRITEKRWVRSVVENGRGMMPAFGRTLSESELSALVDYVTGAFSGEEARAER